MADRPASALLHRDLRRMPATVVRGEGAWLFDAAGRDYLDASGGAAVSCLGHGNRRVAEAIRAQLDRVAYAHTSFFTNEPAEALARRLVAMAPPGFGAGLATFLGSGSEAVEAALKLARQYHVERGEPGRTRLISRRMSYHGNTLGALAVGGHAGRRAMYQPMLAETSQVDPCFAYRFRQEGETEEAYGRRAAASLEAEILRLGPASVAAFIAEPVVGATIGSVPPAPGYFRAIREICDRHGVLLIADEVMCGMGRCGSMFAITQEGVAPDLITIAKGLGAGYQPIGALLASARVVTAIREGSGMLAHGHTYMAHAVACASALAVLDVIEQDGLLAAVARQGAALEARLRDAFGQHPHIGDIRGRGLFWSMELVEDRETRRPFPAAGKLAPRLKQAALAEGLICYPSSGTADGDAGDHVLFAPPFTVSESELDVLVARLRPALAAVLPA
jgi:adenosylmethionine-8-amino-7-oxononanoate aminotransferase